MTKKYNKKWVIAAMTLGVIIFLTIALILFLFQKQDTSDSVSIPPLYPGTEWKIEPPFVIDKGRYYEGKYTASIEKEQVSFIISYYDSQLLEAGWNKRNKFTTDTKIVYSRYRFPILHQLYEYNCEPIENTFLCHGVKWFLIDIQPHISSPEREMDIVITQS